VHHGFPVGAAQDAPDRCVHAVVALLVESPHQGAIARMKKRPLRLVV
jgi:hypothetical protein